MASFKPDPAQYRSLQDKVIVLTGSLSKQKVMRSKLTQQVAPMASVQLRSDSSLSMGL